MASVIFHAFHQINETGSIKLFRSHNENYKDGEQLRDFIYVKDLIEVISFLINRRPKSGIYNVGTGIARSFNDLAMSVFAAMGKNPGIDYIDTPMDIRDKYQYFTEAVMDKLKDAGYEKTFSTLKEGITDYVQQFLLPKKYY